MKRVKHKVHGRQLIHAHVKKIQPALASLVGSQSRQLSYIVRFWITNDSGIIIVFVFLSMGACQVLEGASSSKFPIYIIWSS